MKLFRKKRLGRGVCLSLVTRSLKRTHLLSLSRSCSQFEMLQMLIHLMSDRLSTSVLVCWLIDNLCLVSNRLCCVIFEIMLGKVSSYLSLTFFPKIKVHLFTNKNDELTFWWFGPGYLSARVTFFLSWTFVEMSGVLILIKCNDFSAQSKVTLIWPVRLKVKLKKISGHRMPTDWQFTSIITITVTY